MIGAKEIFFGMIIFSVIIISGTNFLTGLYEGAGSSIDTTELNQLNTFNDTVTEINAAKERIKGAETNPLGTVSVLATGAWIAVKNMFNVIPLVEDIGFMAVTTFGIPQWLYYAIIALLTVAIIFIILGYVTGR